MNYRLLNEVLIEWNKSLKRDSDNVFLKSEDIKESLDRCFIYKLNKKQYIKILAVGWPEFDKYRDKVWIKGKHIKLDAHGFTVDKFEPGEYKVYIEDIDKVTDMTSMFYRCAQLVSAFIPDSVTEIGELAFRDCSGLMNVAIPNSVNSIGENAFWGCSDLVSITIPNSVTTIGEAAFFWCTGLTSVAIGNSVTFIGNYAFDGCIALTSVTIPNSVIKIGKSALRDCTGLTSVTIGNSVTEIGKNTFRDCSSLTSVAIGNSVTFIDDWTFLNCKNLKTVYVEDKNKFKQIQFEGETADPTYYGAKVIELKK